MDGLSDLWEHSERVVCTHPGWATLRGWGRVAASYYSIFANPQRLQFILTQPSVAVQDDVAWVVVDENLLGGAMGATVSAMNLFVRAAGDWKMVGHHASPVAPG